MLKLITIQKVFAVDKLLHSFLAGKGLNKQTIPFFLDKNQEDAPSILMLSPRGHLFRFCLENGKYRSIRFEDPVLLEEMLAITDNAVKTNKYPFFQEALSIIRKNLKYTPKAILF